ncbi:putative methyltransferase-domain-containing protein [Phycomyces nitens]|nr:putative methyltransferase-domain-containing protein [Phycomyces nitens]
MISIKSRQERDEMFITANLPLGLNVTESDGCPERLRSSITQDLALHQNVDEFGLAGKIWNSAYILQAFFSPSNVSEPLSPIPAAYYRNSAAPVPTKPYRILELGAGTGYVGLSVAQHLRSPCEIIITDLAPVVPLMQANQDALFPTPDKQSPLVVCTDLCWGSSADADRVLDKRPFDLIIVSDCVYFPELFGILTHTLREVCGPDTQVVIGYKCRSLEKETGFWQDYFGRYFEYEPVRYLTTIPQTDQTELGGLVGEEEEAFVFVAKKRPENEIKTADDTFTTLLFCSIGI